MDYDDIDINLNEMEDLQDITGDISELIKKGRPDSNYKSITFLIHQNQNNTKIDSKNCLDPIPTELLIRC